MWYAGIHASTALCPPVDGGRTGSTRSWAPLSLGLYGAPLPHPPGECRGPAHHGHRPDAALQRPDRCNAIHAFNSHGLAALTPGSSRPLTDATIFDAARREQLRALLHQSPRTFDKPTSVWTLALAAEVCFAEGITPHPVSDETIRTAIHALGMSWKRAKHWITSPDPAYAQKKSDATG
jgi:transposase